MNPISKSKALFGTLKFILNHPLNVDMRTKALKRWLSWQIGSRLVRGPVVVDFVDNCKLLVRPGMTGATQNIYCGLQEFEEMGFLLHYLSRDDLFVDVGANVGTYTVLAAAGKKARAIAIEPILSSFRALEENIIINKIQDRVELKNIGAGNKSGFVYFTAFLDAVNHVATDSEKSNSNVKCQIDTIDSILGDNIPNLIKIDVEGYEFAVIEGAGRALQSPGLEAVIVELNGSGLRYGYNNRDVYKKLIDYGFTAARYCPFDRKLELADEFNKFSQNTLFVRSYSVVEAKCHEATSFNVFGRHI